MEKFIESLTDAGKTIKIIDHMIYITYPLVKDKRMLIKILVEVQKALTKCINSILQYEYLYKRIRLYNDPKENFRTFREKCAPAYEITEEEVKKILELFSIVQGHNKSTMEFMKKEVLVILSENMEQKVINFEGAKEFVNISKKVLEKVQNRILRKI